MAARALGRCERHDTQTKVFEDGPHNVRVSLRRRRAELVDIVTAYRALIVGYPLGYFPGLSDPLFIASRDALNAAELQLKT